MIVSLSSLLGISSSFDRAGGIGSILERQTIVGEYDVVGVRTGRLGSNPGLGLFDHYAGPLEKLFRMGKKFDHLLVVGSGSWWNKAKVSISPFAASSTAITLLE